MIMISSNYEKGQLGTRNRPYSLFYLFLWKDGLMEMRNPDGYANVYTQSGNARLGMEPMIISSTTF